MDESNKGGGLNKMPTMALNTYMMVTFIQIILYKLLQSPYK